MMECSYTHCIHVYGVTVLKKTEKNCPDVRWYSYAGCRQSVDLKGGGLNSQFILRTHIYFILRRPPKQKY